MKFDIFKDVGGEWRWNAQSGGNILFSSGEGYEKPQKIVQVLRKNVIRGDESLEKALVKALKTIGLNEKGGQIKPVPSVLPVVVVVKPAEEPAFQKHYSDPAWPFPTNRKI